MPALHATSSEMALNALRIDFKSSVNDRDYRLFVSIPSTPAPAGGYSVVYVIDGNLHFGIAVDTARIQSRWPDVRDPVIVGIGYPTMSVGDALTWRNIDLTSPVNTETLSQGWIAHMGARTEDYGRLDDYLRLLDTEVKTRIADLAEINTRDQTLMGHSLGGLTTLHALFRHPESYQQYVAISPSIWWNQRAVLAHEAAFSEQVRRGAVKARVLLSVGSEESTPRHVPGMKVSPESMREMAEDCRMVPNTLELGRRLADLQCPDLVVQTVVHEGDDHNMVPPAGIARGIMFTMRRIGDARL